MKKLDALQKTVIANKILQAVQKEEIEAGEVVTIEFATKKNGELKTFVVKKGEQS